MTIEQIKEKLPDVKVKIGDKIHTGHVRGRLMDFAHVWVLGVPTPNSQCSQEYSWETIQRAVETGRPLIF